MREQGAPRARRGRRRPWNPLLWGLWVSDGLSKGSWSGLRWGNCGIYVQRSSIHLPRRDGGLQVSSVAWVLRRDTGVAQGCWAWADGETRSGKGCTRSNLAKRCMRRVTARARQRCLDARRAPSRNQRGAPASGSPHTLSLGSAVPHSGPRRPIARLTHSSALVPSRRGFW